jgi:hypothetical protein
MSYQAAWCGWPVLRTGTIAAVEFDAALQKVDDAGAAENVLVETFGIRAGKYQRNPALVLRELSHPFEGVLAVRGVYPNPSSPCSAETAPHIRVVVHFSRRAPWHHGRAAWVEIECAKGLNQALSRAE